MKKMAQETIGVGSPEDLKVLETLLDEAGLEYSKYFEDYDPTPWNAVVKGSTESIESVLRKMDSCCLYYETTMELPTA